MLTWGEPGEGCTEHLCTIFLCKPKTLLKEKVYLVFIRPTLMVINEQGGPFECFGGIKVVIVEWIFFLSDPVSLTACGEW